MASDSNSSRFQVYLGQSAVGVEHGLGFNVVSGLTDNIHGTYRHVYFDNCFTSIPLLEHLYENGLYGCGTVRVNRRGFPAELNKSHRRAGATLDFLLFLNANIERFEHILTFPFYKFSWSVLSH
jgi:hypothetical protein